MCTDNILVRLHPVTGEQTEMAYTDADITAFARSGDYTHGHGRRLLYLL